MILDLFFVVKLNADFFGFILKVMNHGLSFNKIVGNV